MSSARNEAHARELPPLVGGAPIAAAHRSGPGLPPVCWGRFHSTDGVINLITLGRDKV
jgi:hypothetical protein